MSEPNDGQSFKDADQLARHLRKQLKQVEQVRNRRKGSSDFSQYESHKERQAARQAELSQSGRDIGKLPTVESHQRKADAEKDFKKFCEQYFPATFCINWSKDHLRVIEAIQTAVLTGGQFCFAMPRGSGKTSLVEAAALWSILYGHHQMICIIGADEEHAKNMLESIKVEVEINEDLLGDFPESCYPIVALEKVHQRAHGQLYQGKPTYVQWTANEVQFPSIKGSKASSGIIRVAGITGRIRGMAAKRASDAVKVRPTLVLIDDPQSDESANSPSQVATREAVLKSAILGLAGPGQKISGLMTVTVVKPDDLADRLLDRSQHPAWQGERTKLVYEWPTDEDKWAEYAELRKEGQRAGVGVKAADEFYEAHQEAMDLGSVVAWPERKHSDELSALQHAYNLLIDRGESAFASEFQNEPKLDSADFGRLQKKGLLERCNLDRNMVPNGCETLTAFIDVQEKVLFWLVMGWNDRFGGSIVSYGCYPDQPTQFFEAGRAKKTMAMAAGVAGYEAALAAGLQTVCEQIFGRDWKREDGVDMRVRQLMVDANYGQSTATVRTFARQSAFANSILPSHGRGVTASMRSLNDKKKSRGDKLGLNWYTGQVSAGQKSCVYDTNFWKTFIAQRLRISPGDPEAVMICKGNNELLMEHLTSEYPVRTEGRGRTVDEWKLSAARENHWFDCAVGCAVAASVDGVSPSNTDMVTRKRRKVELTSGTKKIVLKKIVKPQGD